MSPGATPVLTCGLKFSPVIFGTNVDTYSIMAASMAGSSCGAVNAPMGPVSTVNGFTAAMMSACSLRISGVGFATNARDANRAGRGVVVFEGFQLHGVHVGGGEHLAGGGIDLVEVRRADETLEHRDVRTCASHPGRNLSGRP